MDATTPLNRVLLEVIRTQTDIARLGLDLGGIMTLVTERAQALTGALAAAVELAEDDMMVYRAATGAAAGELGLRLKRDSSLSGLCVQSGQTLYCEDSETDPRVDRDACRRVGLRSMVVVPLKHSDSVVGVLKVMTPLPSGFTGADQRALELLSDLIAAAMFHAGKYGAKELHVRATHDAMTGLPNRALFFDRLNQALEIAGKARAKLGVITIDVDGVKRIGEVHGAKAGDLALTELASRLKVAARRSDIVARIGDDLFAAILPDITSAAQARAHIVRFREHIRLPIPFGEIPLKLDAGIGLAIAPDDGTDARVLVDRAERDMYAMKQTRSENRVRFA
ncbi:MAG TPA: sensor domain-containing diguanylate cyclase [Rhizomicrobium sp.]|jgi:diguanylate cyclase (GGDEF)-like protein